MASQLQSIADDIYEKKVVSYASVANDIAHHQQDDIDELFSSQLSSFVTGIILTTYTNLKGELKLLRFVPANLSHTSLATSIHQMISIFAHQHGTEMSPFSPPTLYPT